MNKREYRRHGSYVNRRLATSKDYLKDPPLKSARYEKRPRLQRSERVSTGMP